MQGTVFTVFRDVVCNHFSRDVFDRAVKVVRPENTAGYDAEGRYPSAELLQLAQAVSEETNSHLPDLLDVFALRLFKQFMFRYSNYHPVWDNALDVLNNVGSVIHLEVCRADNAAKPPKVKSERITPNHLRLHYCSHRPMADFAASLIKACGQFFSEPLDIVRQDISTEGYETIFDVHRVKVK